MMKNAYGGRTCLHKGENNAEDSVYDRLVCWMMGSIHIECKAVVNSSCSVNITQNENNPLICTKDRLIGR